MFNFKGLKEDAINVVTTYLGLIVETKYVYFYVNSIIQSCIPFITNFVFSLILQWPNETNVKYVRMKFSN